MNRLYHLMEQWCEIMETGNTPSVNLFPWLKFIPQRFFGNYVKRSRAIGAQMESLYGDIVSIVIRRREEGVRLGSFMDHVPENNEKHNLPWDQLCFIGGVLMEGGSDTSSSLTISIVQGLMENPEAQ